MCLNMYRKTGNLGEGGFRFVPKNPCGLKRPRRDLNPCCRRERTTSAEPGAASTCYGILSSQQNQRFPSMRMSPCAIERHITMRRLGTYVAPAGGARREEVLGGRAPAVCDGLS